MVSTARSAAASSTPSPSWHIQRVLRSRDAIPLVGDWLVRDALPRFLDAVDLEVDAAAIRSLGPVRVDGPPGELIDAAAMIDPARRSLRQEEQDRVETLFDTGATSFNWDHGRSPERIRREFMPDIAEALERGRRALLPSPVGVLAYETVCTAITVSILRTDGPGRCACCLPDRIQGAHQATRRRLELLGSAAPRASRTSTRRAFGARPPH